MKILTYILFLLTANQCFAQSSDTTAVDVSYYCLMRETMEQPVPTQCYKVLHIEDDKSYFHSAYKPTRKQRTYDDVVDTLQIWKNVSQEGKLDFLGYIFTFSYKYTEPIPEFDWDLIDSDSTVCDYPCKKATTSFRGRQWTVWYSLDMPYSDGPWKLCGLPGLILKAEEKDGDFAFIAHKIAKVPKTVMTIPKTTFQSSPQEYAKHKATFAKSANEYMKLLNPNNDLMYKSTPRTACLFERF